MVKAVKIALISFNLFPHDKILDQTKLKAFVDDKLNVSKIIISIFVNIVEKGEIACTGNFSFSHNVLNKYNLLKTSLL